ncbi:glycosyltransferase family 2 protein, partial [Halochromatium sp.]
MEHTPLVSVIIASKDRQQLLQRAIESVLGQSINDLEIVVVDDGSKVPVRYSGSDPRVRVIRNENSQGLSAARTTGFRAA